MIHNARLRHLSILVMNKITSSIFDSFFYSINNILGLSIAILDIRKRKKIGTKILICRNKYYNSRGISNSEEVSNEKYLLDEALTSEGYEVVYFFWDENRGLFLNQVELWLKIKKINPWIIFFSSYNVGAKSSFSSPTINFLRLLRSKIKSNFIFVWFDTCSDSFYDSQIGRLDKIKAIHLILENPTLNFGPSFNGIKNDSLIPLWTNLVENSFIQPLKKDIDVVFIGQTGSYRSNRREFIDYLMEQNIACYISCFDRDAQIDHKKYAEILGRAKIVLNFSQSGDKDQCKGRVFESMHAESLLIENKNSQTEIWFKDGVDYVSFSDKEDMISKINYYLAHEHERKLISKNGRNKTLKLYNSSLFLKKIFDHKDFLSK